MPTKKKKAAAKKKAAGKKETAKGKKCTEPATFALQFKTEKEGAVNVLACNAHFKLIIGNRKGFETLSPIKKPSKDKLCSYIIK